MKETVTPLLTFEHGGTRHKGQPFACSPTLARQLEAKGMVARNGGHNAPVQPFPGGAPVPPSAAGASMSASPAAPASPQTIAILSEAGEALSKLPKIGG